MQSLKSPGAMVSYQPFETAFKDFICSLMERLDMMGEELLLHIADLQQQIDALEDLNMVKKTVSPRDPEAEL
jgi:DNA-binding MarR family transcriptional regulator